MNRLQQRQQSHRRRQETINNLRKAGKVAATMFLLWFMWQLPGTRAYFTDREETQASFRAAVFADILTISPGKSKTNNNPGNSGPAFNVAEIVAGQIYLDFGTYHAGNDRNFPQVLTVKNISDRTLTLRWQFSGPLAQFFENQDQDIILGPGTEVELGFKLDNSPQDQPGEYLGYLQISIQNGFSSPRIPATLHLSAKKSGKGNNSTVNTKVYNDTGKSVSEFVYQSPDSGNPGQYTLGANDLPDVLESVYQVSGGEDTFGAGGYPHVTESACHGPEDNNGKNSGKKDHKDGHSGSSVAGNPGGKVEVVDCSATDISAKADETSSRSISLSASASPLA